LDQDFTADGPDQKWATCACAMDITYVPTAEGWLYLAVVLDLYSRRIVGWAMSDSLQRQLVIDALQMAMWPAGRHRACCTTPTGAASTPATTTRPC
jgi:putative transposase